jgi:hypothetical protein
MLCPPPMNSPLYTLHSPTGIPRLDESSCNGNLRTSAQPKTARLTDFYKPNPERGSPENTYKRQASASDDGQY